MPTSNNDDNYSSHQPKYRNFGDRLLQTSAMLTYVALAFLLPILDLILAILLPIFLWRYPAFWVCVCMYATWFMFVDHQTARRGARFNATIRNLPLWRHCAEYFPIKLVKCADLAPDRNYIFGIYPHGYGFGHAFTYGTNGANFDGCFGGIKMHLVTLDGNFCFPFRRELMLELGLVSSDRDSIEYLLRTPAKGNAVGLIIGGQRESFETHPTRHRVILTSRKGFVRLAIKHGASIVPVYHFGETNYCNLAECSPFLQRIMRRKMANLMDGRDTIYYPMSQSILASLLPTEWVDKLPGWVRCGFLPLPYRRKIVAVVGAPIYINQPDPEPSEAMVDQIHAEYCSKLVELFNRHKVSEGGLAEDTELELIA